MRATMVVTAVAVLLGSAWGEAGTEGWLGVELQTLTDELRLALDLPEDGGALVNSVVEGSPAAEAGLKRRDFIARFDGEDVDGPRHLGDLVRSAAPGDRVDVALVRDGETIAVSVTLGARPESDDRRRSWAGRRGFPLEFFPGPRAKLGARVVDLGAQMAEFLGTPETEGVLVLEVEDDTPAESAGLSAGDVITHVDGDEILDTSDLIAALEEAEEGETVRLSVVRKGEEVELEAEIEEMEESPPFWQDFQRLWRGGRQQRELQCPSGAFTQ
jgi:serine protease Do